jgi:hypothetical protein
MRRLPVPTHSSHRRHALARGAGAAGVAVLMACLFACKGDDTAEARTGAASPVAMAPADVPPPPVLQGVAAAPAPSSSAAAASTASVGDLTAVRAQLDTALAKASSCSTDAECRTVATGAKACGGPTAYRAFSAKGADPQAIADLAQHERDLTMIQARESGRVSACFMLADPGAHCRKNKCVTGPAGTS